MVVIVDSPDRENEGDVCVAAQHVTAEQITFMAIEARGLICLTLAPDKCDELQLDLMAAKSGAPYETAFTVSIEAAEGVTTGISAADRAHTIRVAADPSCKASDLVKPGHVFPLRAKPLGVLERTGQTEGSVDLAKLAGCEPAAVICEVMNDDGTMARVEDLVTFCAKHQLNMISIEDMIAYRLRTEPQVERRVSVDLPTTHGHFNVVGYEGVRDKKAHLAVVRGDVKNATDVLVRVHSECCTGDVFGSLRCDCGEQLHEALRQIEEAESGVLLYLAQEGRGIGLLEKLKAYELQDQGLDTVEANVKLGFSADSREYYVAAHMLNDLGVRSINLLTNNPRKVAALEEYGVVVNARLPLEIEANDENRSYLATKRDKLGHLLTSTRLNEPVVAGTSV